jgi:hypothetical protein
MRKKISNPGALTSRPFVEADDQFRVVAFEADGRTHRIPPDIARQIGRAMILAASLAETLGQPGEVDDLDDVTGPG